MSRRQREQSRQAKAKKKHIRYLGTWLAVDDGVIENAERLVSHWVFNLQLLFISYHSVYIMASS